MDSVSAEGKEDSFVKAVDGGDKELELNPGHFGSGLVQGWSRPRSPQIGLRGNH